MLERMKYLVCPASFRDLDSEKWRVSGQNIGKEEVA